MKRPLTELARLVGGSIDGDEQLEITGVDGLERAQAGQISFYGNQKYKRMLLETKASVILVSRDAPPREHRTYVRVKNPHLAFARISTLFHPSKQFQAGIVKGALIDDRARIDPSATVMAGAVVSANAVIAARCVLFPGVFVGEGAVIGQGTILGANVSILEGCIVGSNCIIHPSAVIGADGFGFAFDPENLVHVKIPQAGIVRIEDDVEIGACSCIDRSTSGETVVGRGSKIDNLVQVGHNSTIGPLSILCAQVGLSGTTEVGTGVMMGGQSGSAGHLRIGDLAKVGAQSGVLSDVDDGATVLGSPSFPHRDYLRSAAIFGRLPELQKEIRELHKRIEQLERESRS